MHNNQMLELMAVFLEHDTFILEKEDSFAGIYCFRLVVCYRVIKGPFKEIHTSVLQSVGLNGTKGSVILKSSHCKSEV